MEPILPLPLFELQLRLLLPYPALEQGLRATLVGQEITLNEGWLSQRVRADRLDVLPREGDRLRLRVHFSGTFGGSVLLSGKPEISGPHSIRLAAPDYDLESQSILLRTARWMFDRKILELLTSKAEVNLKPHLSAWTGKANTFRGGGGGWELSPHVEDLSLAGLEAQEEGLAVLVRSSGGIKVWPPRS